MLEKIGAEGFETLSKPDRCVVQRLEGICEKVDSPVVYEVGIGVGATSLEIAKQLNGHGELHVFSRENDVDELAEDLARLGYANVRKWGSPGKIYSGYHFDMALAFANEELPHYHLAYLDGGHVMHLDGVALCLLKELALPGAYLILDDIAWTLAKSPTLNPKSRPRTAEEYDARQIETCQVDLARRCFLDPDPRFKLVEETSGSAVYQRQPGLFGFFSPI